MTELSVKKVQTPPEGPWPQSTLYFSKVLVLPTAHIGWRVLMTDVNPVYADVSLSEVDFVYAEDDGGTTPFASSEGTPGSASLAFDGDQTTLWNSDGSDIVGSFVGLIMVNPVALTELSLTPPDADGFPINPPTGWTLQFSDDTTTGLDGTWDNAAVITGQVWGPYETKTHSSAYLSDTELQVSMSSVDGLKLHKSLTVSDVDQLVGDGSSATRTDNYAAMVAFPFTTDSFVYVADTSDDPAGSTGPGMYLYLEDTDDFIPFSRKPLVGGLSSLDW